jgi:hypothetical protein
MPNETPMFEVIWEGDVLVPLDPDEVPCDNPFDWQPVALDEVPLTPEDES